LAGGITKHGNIRVMTHHLAQLNIGRTKAAPEDPIMDGFMSRLDEINAIADESPGFVWRLQTEDGNATSIHAFDDPLLLVNMSVWESIDTFREFTYRSNHKELLQKRADWFDRYEGPYQVMWWVPAGHIPTVEEAKDRLEMLVERGPTRDAFTYKDRFDPPANIKPLSEQISDDKYTHGAEIDRTNKQYTLTLLSDTEPTQVLDVGCGTGLNSSRLAESGHEMFGVDISEVAIAQYNEAGFQGTVCDLSVGLPFDDNTFGAVLASEVVEHVVDTGLFLGEIRRVLKPGGKLVLSTPNSAFWVYRVLGGLGKTVSELQHPGHLRFFSRKMLRAACEQAGFEDIQIRGRSIYLIFSTKEDTSLRPMLKAMRLTNEHRFGTKKDLWHYSRFVQRASSFWTDTLIVEATKPE